METFNDRPGALITFEGGDGSGKGTQTKLLYDYLLSQGLPVKKGGFPMYDTPTGAKVAQYLNGDLGDNVSAEEAGALYQADRLANKGHIIEWIDKGGIFLSDRYVDSNSGHQGGKLPTDEERIAYILANADKEYRVNGLPIPDMTLLFTLPAKLARYQVSLKTAESRANYTTLSHDIHEADVNHLANANEAFALLPELYPEQYRHIAVTQANDSEIGAEMLPRDKIELAVRKAVRPLLLSRGFELLE